MENVVDALKIAFAVMVFTIALSLAMATFSQARQTSEAVLYMNDKTNYYSWEDEANYSNDTRIVGIETIIPTLYRYYKENYTVIFDNISEPIYYRDSAKQKWTGTSTSDKVYSFDLNSEIKANCPWVGTVNDIKKNLDLFLDGTLGKTDTDISFGNINRKVQYSGFIEYVKTTSGKFLEQLGEYSTDRTYGMVKEGNSEYLEVQDSQQKKARFEQNTSGTWNLYSQDSGFQDKDGNLLGSGPFTLEQITTKIGSSSSTFLDPDSGEIIELAKPTIKRVIKYTLQ